MPGELVQLAVSGRLRIKIFNLVMFRYPATNLSLPLLQYHRLANEFS